MHLPRDPHRGIADNPSEERIHISTPRSRDGRRSDHVFQQDIPPYDEGPELPQADVRVHVGGTGFGHSSAELRVAEGGEDGSEAGQEEGDDDTWAGYVFGHGAGEDVDAGAHHVAHSCNFNMRGVGFQGQKHCKLAI